MRIFISYARQDQAAVETLNADLERARVHVWMDEELTGGESWWDTILEQIRACDLYIFGLSPDSLRSGACKAELDYAIALDRPLLPVLVRDVAIQLAHPAIARTQMVDYRKRSMDSLLALDGRYRQSTSDATPSGSSACRADNAHVLHERIPRAC